MHKIFLNDLPDNLELTGDIAIDTETLGLNIKRDRLCLVQIADTKGQVVLVKYDGTSYNSPNLIKLLSDKSRTKIFHFARFDVAVLMNALGLKEISPIFCTKIASRLTRTYTDYHGLKTICRELLGVDLDKESQSSNWAAEFLTEKQIKYAISDVIHLHKLKENLEQSLRSLKREDLADACHKFMNTVCKMDILGFEFDKILNH
jgi:ribonuclease D